MPGQSPSARNSRSTRQTGPRIRCNSNFVFFASSAQKDTPLQSKDVSVPLPPSLSCGGKQRERCGGEESGLLLSSSLLRGWFFRRGLLRGRFLSRSLLCRDGLSLLARRGLLSRCSGLLSRGFLGRRLFLRLLNHHGLRLRCGSRHLLGQENRSRCIAVLKHLFTSLDVSVTTATLRDFTMLLTHLIF